MYMFVCLGATSVADYYCKIEREKKKMKKEVTTISFILLPLLLPLLP